MKQCGKCKEVLPFDAFNKDRSRPDGLRFYCRECTNATNRAWYEANAGKVSAAKKAYYEANAEQKKAYNRAYYAANAALLLLKDHLKRAEKAGVKIYDIPLRDWIRVGRQPCAHCAPGECKGKLEYDHILPLALGGPHRIGNFQMLCTRANKTKQDRLEVVARASRRISASQ